MTLMERAEFWVAHKSDNRYSDGSKYFFNQMSHDHLGKRAAYLAGFAEALMARNKIAHTLEILQKVYQNDTSGNEVSCKLEMVDACLNLLKDSK